MESDTTYSFRLKDSLLGAQMLFVAFGALVLVPILTGMSTNVALFTAGVGTLIFQICTRGKVPVFLASSFAFIAPIIYGVQTWGLPATLGGMVVAGAVYVVLSFIIRWRGTEIIMRLLPPIVTGPVIIVIGLVLATLFNNAGLFPNLAEAAQSAEYEAKEYAGFMSTLVSIFPTNMWKSFTEANMLQVIVIALLFGGAIMAAGEKAKLCRDIVTSFYAVIDKLMTFVISLAPIGVFAYMSWVVATQGAAILGSLALVILCAYIGYMIHAVVVYSVSARVFAGISPWAFFKGASAAMIFAFTSTSSAATLPVSKECAADMGAEDDIAAFVLPLGATINMDGTAIYQCVATVFLATCAGMHLTLGQMVLVVVTATLASIGTAGVSGAGMIMLAMVLQAMNIPVDMIMIIYGVDRLFDMGRTCLNITGDISCALCVTKWESKKQTAVK